MIKEKFFQNRIAFIALVSAAVVVTISMGLRHIFGLFSESFARDLQCTATQFGLAIGIQMIVWGGTAALFGALADKIGGNKVTVLCFVFYALGIFLLYSGPNTGIYFQINLGLLVGLGLGGTALSVQISAAGKHFSNKNRDMAVGIIVASASIGFFLAPMYTTYALSEFGWQKTLQTLLYFIIFATIAGFFLLPVQNNSNDKITKIIKDQTIKEALNEAFRHKGYVLLIFGFFVCGFQITLVSAHIPGYLQGRGFPDSSAVIILSLIGLFNVFGTLTFGYCSGKFSKKILLSLNYFGRGLAIIFFMFMPASPLVAIIFGVVFGFLWLSTVPPTSGIVTQIFGTQYSAMLYGIVFFSHQVGSLLGAFLGGYFFDQYGSYDYAWYISIALSLFASLIHLPIDEKPLARLSTT